jgi:hypothetical protein
MNPNPFSELKNFTDPVLILNGIKLLPTLNRSVLISLTLTNERRKKSSLELLARKGDAQMHSAPRKLVKTKEINGNTTIFFW